jgi:hypothetical protein
LPDAGEAEAAIFARKKMDMEVEQTGLRTPATGRSPTI